jgi:hypothetical protein
MASGIWGGPESSQEAHYRALLRPGRPGLSLVVPGSIWTHFTYGPGASRAPSQRTAIEAVVARTESWVPHIFLLSLGAAGSLAVQLIAVVLVILTREHPKPLLWAFWLSAMVVSCGSSYVVLAVFRAKGTILGNTAQKVSPSVYLTVGVIALVVAIFAATKRGRDMIGREMEKQQSSSTPDPDGSFADRARAKAEVVKSKAEEALQSGSVWVAIAAGVVLGAPTPFSLAAVGTMVRNGYRLPTQLLLILGFSLVTYLVVELPIISYAIRPDATAARVDTFSTWLGTHKIQAAAATAGVVGVLLIIKGLTAL